MIPTSARARAIPPDLRSELEEAAFNHGYRRATGEADGWLYFASDINVPGEIGLAVTDRGETWFLAIGHPGVAAELDCPSALPTPSGMCASFGFPQQSQMRKALHRAYGLACSLPTMPLHEYQAEIAGLGSTEAEQLTKQRRGQQIFRRALERYWEGRCPLTGITEPEMLRASHILPWAACSSDAERLDVHNGLLLAAHWDAAFDSGLASFSDEGALLLQPHLSPASLKALRSEEIAPLSLTDEHRRYLAWHRRRYSFD